jgi:hypothetical protein
MNDMYDTCPPVRPTLRTSQPRVTIPSQPSLDAKVVIMGSAGTSVNTTPHNSANITSGVGKTSLVTRYVEERFAAHTTTTTGAFFHSKKVTVDGTKVRLQIWDTAGQERFRSMVSPLSTSSQRVYCAAAPPLPPPVASPHSYSPIVLGSDVLPRR